MEFRLLYQGELRASGNRSAVENKHLIRKSFHLQLGRLWKTNSGLRQLAAHNGNVVNPRPNATTEERIEAGLETLGKQRCMHGFNWVPVALESFALRCSLDILLLRPEGEVPIPGKTKTFILENSDIDGQVKTLLDALRIPKQLQELPAGITPDPGETPFFCLLYDDRLISEIHINAAPLLLLPGSTMPRPTDAVVIIHVQINHANLGTFDHYYQ